MESTIVDTVEKIKDKSKWNAYADLCPGGQEIKTDFLWVLEQSFSSDFKFHYIEIYDKEELVFCCPVFIMDNVPLELALQNDKSRQLISNFKKRSKQFLSAKVLFLGTPLNDELCFADSRNNDFSKIIDDLFPKIVKLSNIHNTDLIMFKNLIDNSNFAFLKKYGFFSKNALQNCIINCNFNTFEDYLKSLDSRKRRNAKAKLRKAQGFGYKVEISSTIENNLSSFFSLFEETYQKSNYKFERPNTELFHNMSTTLKNQVFWISILENDLPVASSYFYIEQDCLAMKRIGINYSSSIPYIYFILHYETIKYAISKGIKSIKLGPTTYSAKKEMGAYLQPTYLIMKHRNPILNQLLQILYHFFDKTSVNDSI